MLNGARVLSLYDLAKVRFPSARPGDLDIDLAGEFREADPTVFSIIKDIRPATTIMEHLLNENLGDLHTVC